LKDTVQGYGCGRRSVRESRIRWIEDIAEWTGLKISEAVCITEDRN